MDDQFEFGWEVSRTGGCEIPLGQNPRIEDNYDRSVVLPLLND
jgi:hypothetical protein